MFFFLRSSIKIFFSVLVFFSFIWFDLRLVVSCYCYLRKDCICMWFSLSSHGIKAMRIVIYVYNISLVKKLTFSTIEYYSRVGGFGIKPCPACHWFINASSDYLAYRPLLRPIVKLTSWPSQLWFTRHNFRSSWPNAQSHSPRPFVDTLIDPLARRPIF